MRRHQIRMKTLQQRGRKNVMIRWRSNNEIKQTRKSAAHLQQLEEPVAFVGERIDGGAASPWAQTVSWRGPRGIHVHAAAAVPDTRAGAPRAGRRRSLGRVRGLRVQAAGAVPDARAGSACRPRGAACWPSRARAQGRPCWPSPGGGGGDEARGWGTRTAWRDGPLNC